MSADFLTMFVAPAPAAGEENLESLPGGVIELVRGALDLVPDAVLTVDGRHRIVGLNHAACLMFGYELADLVGEPLDVLLPVDVGARHRAHVAAFGAGDTAAKVMGDRRVLNGRRRDGEQFGVEITIGKIVIGGKCFFNAVLRDVSERRIADAVRDASLRRMHLLLQNALDGLLMWDASGTITYASPYVADLTGIPTTDLVGTSGLQMVHPDDLEGATCALQNGLTAAGSSRGEMRLCSGAGGWVWIEWTTLNLLDDPDVGSLIANFADISQRKIADGQRAAVARLGMEALAGCEFDQLALMAVEALVEHLSTDSAAILEHGDPDADELVVRACAGWPADSVGQAISAPPGSPSRAALSHGAPFIIDDYATHAWFPTKDLIDAAGYRSGLSVAIAGRERPWGTISALSRTPNRFGASDADFVRAVANVLATAIERDRTEDQLAQRVLHDVLTGLPNRLMFTDRLEHALAHIRRHGHMCGVLFVDLDRFKAVNDTLGHSVGDQVLIDAAARIRTAVRDTDTVARLGGDEFVVLCEDIDGIHHVTDVAQRIITVLQKPFHFGDETVFVSASVGVALSADGALTADAMLANADIAMYRAKDNGRSRYELFDETMQEWVATQTALEADLRWAVPRDQLRLYYQPIIAADTGEIQGFEALVRWERPGFGLVPPDGFIPTAEDAGFIVDIGSWVLEEACRNAAAWAQRWPNKHLGVAVNVSSRQLASGEFVDLVTDVLERTGLDPIKLTLELTESTLIDDAVNVDALLRELRDLGLSVAIDDFGTGYSSLTYLRAFPINVLKIDKSFVSAIGTDREDTAIVAAVLALAKNLGLRVVAEGVERHEQLATLMQLQCPYMQGYLFSRPRPSDEIVGLVEGPVLGLWLA